MFPNQESVDPLEYLEKLQGIPKIFKNISLVFGLRLDSNIESKSSNYTFLNIIEIFNKLFLHEKSTLQSTTKTDTTHIHEINTHKLMISKEK